MKKSLALRIKFFLFKLAAECERGWPCRLLVITLKKEDYFNRGNEHVGEIKEVDNPGTDGRGREKVDFELQIFKVARS